MVSWRTYWRKSRHFWDELSVGIRRISMWITLVLVCFSCNNNNVPEDDEDDGTCNIVMLDDKIQRPKWLKSIADSINGIYLPRYPDNQLAIDYVPPTFNIKHQEQDYILVRDNLCFTISIGYLFFNCSGKKVISKSDLWWDLMTEILPCDIMLTDDGIYSPQWIVRASDSIANQYSPRGVWIPPVYHIPYKEQDYLLLIDMPSCCSSMNFFTCLGEKIDRESDLWQELNEEYFYIRNKTLMIWRF